MNMNIYIYKSQNKFGLCDLYIQFILRHIYIYIHLYIYTHIYTYIYIYVSKYFLNTNHATRIKCHGFFSPEIIYLNFFFFNQISDLKKAFKLVKVTPLLSQQVAALSSQCDANWWLSKVNELFCACVCVCVHVCACARVCVCVSC